MQKASFSKPILLLVCMTTGCIGFLVGVLNLPADEKLFKRCPPAPPAATVEISSKKQTIQGRPTIAKQSQTDTPTLQQLSRQVKQLEQRLSFGKVLIKGYQTEFEGEPLQWSAEIPEIFSPDHFKATVDQAMKQCDVPGELIKIDCQEPPCVAIILIDESKVEESGWVDSFKCPAWNKTYSSMANRLWSASCPDGSHEVFSMLTSPFDFKKMTAQEVENWFKRYTTRGKSLELSWKCGAKQ
jgi:hypothetical protein